MRVAHESLKALVEKAVIGDEAAGLLSRLLRKRVVDTSAPRDLSSRPEAEIEGRGTGDNADVDDEPGLMKREKAVNQDLQPNKNVQQRVSGFSAM